MRTLLIAMLLVLNGCATQKVDTAFCESERDKIAESLHKNHKLSEISSMMVGFRVYKVCMTAKGYNFAPGEIVAK